MVATLQYLIEMGNKNSVHAVPGEEPGFTSRVFFNEKVKIRQRTRKRIVFIIALCCSTVVNTVEPENQEPYQRSNSQDYTTPNVTINHIVVPPKKPLNSKPRVRRYGYGFSTKVTPLVLSADDIEELNEVGESIKENNFAELSSNFFTNQNDGPCPVCDNNDDMELIKTLLAEKEQERMVRHKERARARSAVMENIKKNEIKRMKMNEQRLLQAKLKRETEKLKQNAISKSFQPLAPIKEDKEGEELEKPLMAELRPPTSRSRRASVAPIVIRNRIQQRLTRKDLYLKAIQELLEIGDAYQVMKRSLSRISDVSDDYEDSSEDDENEVTHILPFNHKLQRKMSLSGLNKQYSIF